MNHLTPEILWSFDSEIKIMSPAKAVSNAQSIRLAKKLDQKLSYALDENVEVILFGSQARGDAAEESDIDVLVLLPSLERSTLDTVLEIAWEVGFEAGKVISVVPATHDEMKLLSASPFFQVVKREGIPV